MCVWQFFILNKCVPGMLVSIDISICLHLIQHHFISCLFCPQFLCILYLWYRSADDLIAIGGIFSESLNWYHLAIYSFTPGPMASFDWPIQPVPFCRFLFFVPFARSSTSPLCWNERNPQPYCCVMMIISCKSSASQHIVYYES